MILSLVVIQTIPVQLELAVTLKIRSVVHAGPSQLEPHFRVGGMWWMNIQGFSFTEDWDKLGCPCHFAAGVPPKRREQVFGCPGVTRTEVNNTNALASRVSVVMSSCFWVSPSVSVFHHHKHIQGPWCFPLCLYEHSLSCLLMRCSPWREGERERERKRE